MLLGVALAIVFFNVYGFFSRPSVPMPVAAVVGQFAPGVEIGARVTEARHGVAAMNYVPHLGYVGVPQSKDQNTPTGRTVNFSQVRLLLDQGTRSQASPDPAKARVDAVELVTADAAATDDITAAIASVIRRPPREGCLRTPDAGRLRQVHVWTTPNDRGGIAVINDFFIGSPSLDHGPYMTNVLAFVGKFEGGRTLRGNYTDANCTEVEAPPS
jgi:hypothetical protein